MSYSNSILEVKSKYDAEFRRFGLNRISISKFDEFYQLLERLHGLYGIQFNICYTDKDGDLLPINNDNNLARVLQVTMGVLRLIILRKGECYPDQLNNLNQFSHMSYSNTGNLNSNSSYRASNLINQIKELSTTLTSHSHHNHHSNYTPKPFVISYPEDFRPVSAIIDVDILPDTYRRVRLHKHKSSKPLGFYIRDGRSLRVTPHGVEQVPGIFISRLMPGGLAESTGLLSVNDEVIEVNGIEVAGKTLDQVTDMMVANSSNLIITVKPTNQKYNLNRTNNLNTSCSNNKIPTILNSQSRSSIKRPDLSKISQANSNKNQNNGSCSISSSSVNSSFSSLNKNTNQIRSNSFNTTNNSNSNINNNNNINNKKQVADSGQIVLDLKSSLDEDKNNVSDEEEDEDDDDDDEEIHDATGQHPHSSDHDNSDDKILTL